MRLRAAHRRMEARRVEAPTSPSGRARAAAARCRWRRARSGAIRPAMFSSSTANGSAHRWRWMPQRRQRLRPGRRATRCMRIGAQADALGRAGGARREGDLGRARRHRHRRRRAGAAGATVSPATSQGCAGASGQRAASGGAQRAACRRRPRAAHARSAPRVKNSGSGTCTTPASRGGQVGDDPGRRVVQQGREHAHAVRLPSRAASASHLGLAVAPCVQRRRPVVAVPTADPRSSRTRACRARAPAAAARAADGRRAPCGRWS